MSHPSPLPSKLRRAFSTSVLTCGIAMILGLAVGCSFVATEHRSEGGHRVLIPWSRDGQYKFEAIPLPSLLSVSNLVGKASMYLLSPSVIDQKLAGFQPRVRTFRDNDGVYVPTDELSLHLLTLYAHIEKLQDLDAAVGLGQLLPKPRIVGVEVRIPQKHRGQVENNALYSPQLDALLFVPYKGDDLPLTVNAGVIAHEHFHSLFNYLVLKPARAKIRAVKAAQVHAGEEKELRAVFEDIPVDAKVENGSVGRLLPDEATKAPGVVGETENDPANIGQESVALADWEIYHINLLRAMNEGLADVWGWIYSGDNIFVRRSIPGVQKSRDLERSGPQKLYSMETFRQMTLAASIAGDESVRAYELGTIYARALKNVFEPQLQKSGRTRLDVAKLVVKVLPKLKDKIETIDKNQWLKPTALLELFVQELSPEDAELCVPLLRTDPEISETTMTSACAKKTETP
jgi:hypothetical protein